MLENIDGVAKWLKLNKLKFWRIEYGDGRKFAAFDGNDDTPINESWEAFADNVTLLPKGEVYRVFARVNDKATAAEKMMLLYTSTQAQVQPYINGGGINNATSEAIMALQMKLQAIELENKFKEILREKEAEIEKIKAKANQKSEGSNLDKILGVILPMFAGAMQPPQSPPVQPRPQAQAPQQPPAQEAQEVDEAQTVIGESLTSIHEALGDSSDFLDLLREFSNFAKRDPETFRSQLTMLGFIKPKQQQHV